MDVQLINGTLLTLTRWGNQITACFCCLGNGRSACCSDTLALSLQSGLLCLDREWRISGPLSLMDPTAVRESGHCCLLPPGKGWKISSLFGLVHISQLGIESGPSASLGWGFRWKINLWLTQLKQQKRERERVVCSFLLVFCWSKAGLLKVFC